LIALYKEIWKEPPWNEYFWNDEIVNEEINSALNQKDFVGKLAINSNDIIGFTWGYSLPNKFHFLDDLRNLKTFYIAELAVERNFRRRGIGTKLVNMMIEDARKLDYEIVTLRTHIKSVAYNFYLKLGFEDMKIRDSKYPERTYMKKEIR
jgi:ribosomal protein S18 acetylase RimI-like enzyme